jgi:hypothetical protein
MCNQAVRQQLVDRVLALGRVHSETGSINELRRKCGIESSNKVFKRALGSAVKDGLVYCPRPAAQGVDDGDRSMTLIPGRKTSRKLVPQITPYSESLRPYFVS